MALAGFQQQALQRIEDFCRATGKIDNTYGLKYIEPGGASDVERVLQAGKPVILIKSKCDVVASWEEAAGSKTADVKKPATLADIDAFVTTQVYAGQKEKHTP